MKNIELTENHKVKLLEMCKELFPKYNYYSLHKIDNILTFRSNYFYNHDDDWNYDKQVHIHWFEFCWKILNKILSNNKTISPVYIQECITIFGMICFNNSGVQHPIDHLYEIFKQNEKN